MPHAFRHARWRGLPIIRYRQLLLTILTSMFLHGGWLHIIFNMWFLWIFGDNIEDYLGHFTYLIFYLLCGTAAALTQIALAPIRRFRPLAPVERLPE